MTPDALRDLIDASAAVRAELRFIHFARHLETPPLLTADQIALYNDLRCYGAADPCDAVPEGHDPTMWRRHNVCNGKSESVGRISREQPFTQAILTGRRGPITMVPLLSVLQYCGTSRFTGGY